MACLTSNWYECVENRESITQGDILFNFQVPVIMEHSEPPYFKAGVSKINVIVMTQACDLANDKVQYVTLCPILSLEDTVVNHLKRETLAQAKNMGSNFKSPKSFDLSPESKDRKNVYKFIDRLKRGNYSDLHLLNQSNKEVGLEMNAQVVGLKKTYQIPIKSINNYLQDQPEGEKRLRLLPPYREHLAQAFVNTFARIGLPQDINTEVLRLNIDNPLEIAVD